MDLIDFISLRISNDEDSFCLSLTSEIASLEGWNKCIVDEPIEININGELLYFYIDSKERKRSFGEWVFSITGRSKASRMAEGKASLISRVYPETTAHQIILDLCTEYEVDLEFLIEDWIIPENEYEVENKFPIQVIAEIADATGAILQSKPDGTLVVDYKHSKSPTEYTEDDIDLILSDIDDIFSVSEERINNPGYNVVTLSNKDYSTADNTTIEELDEFKDIYSTALAVRPTPWKNNVTLSHTSQNVVIVYDGIVIEEIFDSCVEVVGGIGRLSKPCFEILGVDYKYTNLGTYEVADNELRTEISAESVADVTYTTRYHKFSVSTTQDNCVQFLTYD